MLREIGESDLDNMATAEELILQINAQGADEAEGKLEQMEGQLEETTDQMGEQTGQLQEFAATFRGALSAAVAGLAVAAGGLLTQVPVLGEAFSGLRAVIDAVALAMDDVLRPVISPLTDAFFEISDAISGAEGSVEDFIGIFGTIGSGVAIAVGALTALGVSLSGPILAAIAGVAAAIGGLWLAWQTNFGNIRGVTMQTVNFIVTRIRSFIEIVRPIINTFISWVTTEWNKWGDEIMAVVQFVFKTIGAVIKQVVDGILTTLQVLVQLLTGDFKGAWNSIVNFIDRTVSRWVPLISTAIDSIITTITNIDWVQLGKDIVNGIIEGLAFFATRLAEGAVTIGMDIADYIGGIVDDALDWGKDLVEEFVNGVQNAAGDAADAVGDAVDDIVPTIKFDIRENDLMAQRWGEDMIYHFATGAKNQAEEENIPAPFSETGGRAQGLGVQGGGGSAINLDGRRLNESTGRYGYDQLTRRGI